MQITPGETGKLPYHSSVGTTGLYVQAKLYDGSTLLTTLNLTEVSGGYYSVDYTPDGTHKHIFAQLIPYTNSGHTIKAEGDLETSIDIYVEYPYRMQMGSSGVAVNIDYKLLAKEIWEYKIDDDEKAKDILLKKSEFNSKNDIVKTDLKIEKPVFNTRILQDLIVEKIDNLENKIGNIKLTPIENKIDLKPIINEIKKINTNEIDLKPIINEIRNIGTDKNDLKLIINEIKSINANKINFKSILNEIKNIDTNKNELIILVKIIKDIFNIVNFLPKKFTIETQIVNEKIKKELEVFKNSLKDNENMLEMLNVEDNKRIKKVLIALDKIYFLITANQLSLRKEIEYAED